MGLDGVIAAPACGGSGTTSSSGSAGGSTTGCGGSSGGTRGSSATSSAGGSGSGGTGGVVGGDHVIFVGPAGKDTTAGTKADPFASINHALGMAVAGDTVFVRAGV